MISKIPCFRGHRPIKMAQMWLKSHASSHASKLLRGSTWLPKLCLCVRYLEWIINVGNGDFISYRVGLERASASIITHFHMHLLQTHSSFHPHFFLKLRNAVGRTINILFPQAYFQDSHVIFPKRNPTQKSPLRDNKAPNPFPHPTLPTYKNPLLTNPGPRWKSTTNGSTYTSTHIHTNTYI